LVGSSEPGANVAETMKFRGDLEERNIYFLASALGVYNPFVPGMDCIERFRGAPIIKIFREAGLEPGDPRKVKTRTDNYVLTRNGFYLDAPHLENSSDLRGEPLEEIRGWGGAVPVHVNTWNVSHKTLTPLGYIEIGWKVDLQGDTTAGAFNMALTETLKPQFESFAANIGSMRFELNKDGIPSIEARSEHGSISISLGGESSVSLRTGRVELKVTTKFTPWVSYIKVETKTPLETTVANLYTDDPNNPDVTIQVAMFTKFVFFHSKKKGTALSPSFVNQNVPGALRAWAYIVPENQRARANMASAFNAFNINENSHADEIIATLNNGFSALNLAIAAAMVAAVLVLMISVAIVGGAPAIGATGTTGAAAGAAAAKAYAGYAFGLGASFTPQLASAQVIN